MSDRVFSNYGFFRDGTQRLQKDFLACANDLSGRRDSPIYRVGDTARQVYLVGQGSVDVYVSSFSGRNVSLYTVEPGELCPINLEAAMSKGTYLANAKVREDLEGASVSLADFRRIMMHHADFRGFVISCLAPKFESIINQISEITTRSVDARIERFFLDHIDDVDEHGFLHVTNEQIGSEIGASREVVNRKLRDLRNSGIIESGRGRIRLLQKDKLLGLKGISPCGREAN